MDADALKGSTLDIDYVESVSSCPYTRKHSIDLHDVSAEEWYKL